MNCWVQVAPPSKEMPSKRPTAADSTSVDIVTILEGLVGLTAMACSASFPDRRLTSTFVGICAEAGALGMTTENSNAATIRASERGMVRHGRLRMIALPIGSAAHGKAANV